MKNLFLALFASLFGLPLATAQTYVYDANVTSDPSDSCGRVIDVSLSGYDFPMTYYITDGSTTTYYTTTGSPIHLCKDQYIYGYDQSCHMMDMDFTDDDSLHPHFFLKNITFDVGASPSPCDNTLSFTVSGLQGHPMRVQLDDYDMMVFGTIYDNIINDSTFMISGLCLGDYTGPNIHSIGIFVWDTVTLKYCNWQFFSPPVGMPDGTTTCTGTLSLHVNAVPASDMSTCNGSVTTMTTGDNPPFTYAYSNGGTTASQTSLCPGMYNVTVTDAVGNSRSSAFLIADSANIYYDNPLHTPVDTLLAGAYLDCDIDFTQPFDSVYINSIVNLTPEVVHVTYVIEQDTNTYEWSETYYTDTAGYYCFVINVFCEETTRATPHYFTAYLFGQSGGMVGVADRPEPNQTITLYPNPANTVVQLKGLGPVNQVNVYDLNGKLVLQNQNCNGTLYTGNLPNGTYIVKTLQQQRLSTVKMVVCH